MKKIVIIDYGCGNILSIARAIEHIGYKLEITNDKNKIINSSNVILPGVGAFGSAIKNLDESNLRDTILEYAKIRQKPLLGICLGMQILLTVGKEFGVFKGLNLIEGEVIKISNTKLKNFKIPHVGWNEVSPSNDKQSWSNKILNDSLIGKSFYFVHSYMAVTKNPSSTIGSCDYLGKNIPSIISSGKILGCQFHPEKSGKNGLDFLRNFCEMN
jgi:imidazole glycerol-phosphate synthase subunit HisH